MAIVKCVDCGVPFEFKSTLQTVKVQLKNPGVVFFEANASACPNCGHKYIGEDESDQAMDAFEKACKEKKQSEMIC